MVFLHRTIKYVGVHYYTYVMMYKSYDYMQFFQTDISNIKGVLAYFLPLPQNTNVKINILYNIFII